MATYGFWKQQAHAAIARIDATLPPAASLTERRRALRAGYPFGERSGWAYKAWLRAQKEYLRRHPDASALEKSPLWQAAKPARRRRVARLRFVGHRVGAEGGYALFRCARCGAEAQISPEALGRALHRAPECGNCNVRSG